MKIGKNPLGSWTQGFAGSVGSWAFFLEIFGLVKNRIESDMNGEYKRHALQQK